MNKLTIELDDITLLEISKASIEICVSVAEAVAVFLKKGLGLISYSSSRGRPPKNLGANEFIKENWRKMSDTDMAKALGLKRLTIALKRYKLGLKRNKDEKWLNQETEFLKSYWETMTDGELAEKIGKGRSAVYNTRLSLGLKRKKGKINKIFLSMGPEEIRAALTKDGFTLSDLALKHRVSHERMRQIADDLLIKRSDRTPEWYANHYKKPEMVDKGFLEKKLMELGSANAVAESLGLIAETFRHQAIRLGIDANLLKEHGELVELKCSLESCGKTFYRRKCIVRPDQKLFFCDRICQGKYLGRLHGFQKKGIALL